METFGARGTELIVGARNDPDWGTVLLVGLGGVFAEALQDTRLIVPGASTEKIVETLLQLKGCALLRVFRGVAAPDLNAVAEIVQRLGDWLAQHPEVIEVDVNPVMAYPVGAIALDALIVVR